mmetsp:Transcript_34362/g.50299  ORF Transcript_34362/g.50299 Transcript_34362/m.50299 type:complete len:101 (+) Transcript_34362:203-505(+)
MTAQSITRMIGSQVEEVCSQLKRCVYKLSSAVFSVKRCLHKMKRCVHNLKGRVRKLKRCSQVVLDGVLQGLHVCPCYYLNFCAFFPEMEGRDGTDALTLH